MYYIRGTELENGKPVRTIETIRLSEEDIAALSMGKTLAIDNGKYGILFIKPEKGLRFNG